MTSRLAVGPGQAPVRGRCAGPSENRLSPFAVAVNPEGSTGVPPVHGGPSPFAVGVNPPQGPDR